MKINFDKSPPKRLRAFWAFFFGLLVSLPTLGWGQTLNVPWVSQDYSSCGWSTNYCGPADIEMMDAFYKKRAATKQGFVDINKQIFGSNAAICGNSTTADQLVNVAKTMGYSNAKKFYPTFEQLKLELLKGNPCIVGVTTQLSGNCDNYTTNIGHWVVVIGFNGDDVIVNDSGRKSSCGQAKTYTKARFTEYWAKQGYVAITLGGSATPSVPPTAPTNLLANNQVSSTVEASPTKIIGGTNGSAITLSWTKGSNITGQLVYLFREGSLNNNLANSANPAAAYEIGTSATSFNAGVLGVGSYRWNVVSVASGVGEAGAGTRYFEITAPTVTACAKPIITEFSIVSYIYGPSLNNSTIASGNLTYTTTLATTPSNCPITKSQIAVRSNGGAWSYQNITVPFPNKLGTIPTNSSNTPLVIETKLIVGNSAGDVESGIIKFTVPASTAPTNPTPPPATCNAVPTVSISTLNQTVYVGDPVTINYSVSAGTNCSISQVNFVNVTTGVSAITGSNTSYTTSFSAAGTYNYRIQATNSYGTGSSDTRTITVNPKPLVCVAPSVSLSAPANGSDWAANSSLGLSFMGSTQNPTTCPILGYEMNIYRNGVLFLSPTVVPTLNNHALSNMQVGTYQWEVRAKNQAGYSPWSERRTFTVTDYSVVALAAPVLETGSAALNCISASVNIASTQVSGASIYEFLIADNPNMTNAQVRASNSAVSARIYAFNPQEWGWARTYYVKARVYSANNAQSPLSNSIVVSTVSQAPDPAQAVYNITAGQSVSIAASNLATGALLEWYNAQTGGLLLYAANNYTVSPTTTTTYWVSQFVNGCKSNRTPILVNVSSPTLTVSLASQNVPYTSGAFSVGVQSNVAFTTSSNAVAWLSISGQSSTGFMVNFTTNTNAIARNGVITITAGGITKTINVTQDAQTSVNVSTNSLSLANPANSQTTLGVLANTTWSASNVPADLTLTPSSGSGNATVTVKANTQNPTANPRIFTFNIAGNTVTVTQAGTVVVVVPPLANTAQVLYTTTDALGFSGISNVILHNNKFMYLLGTDFYDEPSYPDAGVKWGKFRLIADNAEVSLLEMTRGAIGEMVSTDLKLAPDGKLAMTYRNWAGSGYAFDGLYKVWNGTAISTTENHFTSANFGIYNRLHFGTNQQPQIASFSAAGYFFAHSDRSSGTWGTTTDNYLGSWLADYTSLTIGDTWYVSAFTGTQQKLFTKSGSAAWQISDLATGVTNNCDLKANASNEVFSLYVQGNDLKLQKTGGTAETVATSDSLDHRATLHFDNAGVPYVAYMKGKTGIRVLKKTSTTWTEVYAHTSGLRYTNYYASSRQPSLLIKGTDLYVVYNDNFNVYAHNLTAVPVVPTSPPNLATDLVLDMPMNGNAQDISVNNNNGTVNGATPTTGRDGTPNGAYLLNNNSISVSNSASLQFSNAFSYSIWIKLISTSGIDGYGASNQYGYHPILSKNCDRQYVYSGIGTGANNNFSYQTGTWGGMATARNVPIQIGQWMHLSTTYDGNRVKLFLNGQVIQDTLTQIDFTAANATDLIIGKFNCWGYYFNGAVDDLKIWKRALTESEVQALYGVPQPSVVTLSAPTSLTATAASASQVNLAWANANTTNVTGIQVERAVGNGAFSFVTALPANATSHNVTGLQSNTLHRFRVRAVGANSSFSDYSNIASATTQPIVAPPTGSDPFGNPVVTNVTHTVFVPANLSATGLTLANNDVIALGYMESSTFKVAGKITFTGVNDAFNAYGDDVDTPTKDGFTANETFAIKLWKASENKVYSLKATYSALDATFTHQGNFAENGISGLANLTVVSDNQDVMQTILIKKGNNYVGLYVIPTDASMVNILAANSAKIRQVKNSIGKVYLPSKSLNQIGNWKVGEGYQITALEDFTLTVTGKRIDVSATPLTLSAGWNLVAYTQQGASSAVSALAGINTQLVLVKDEIGRIYSVKPFVVNKIGDLLAGKAYYIKTTAATTLTYPAVPYANASSGGTGGRTEETESFATATDNNASILIEAALLKNVALGSRIEVVNQRGEIVGGAIFTGENLAFPIYGQDEQNNGLKEGELFDLQVVSNEKICKAAVRFNQGNAYQANGIFIAEKLQLEAINAFFTVYPNPFREKTNFQFTLNQASDVSLEIFNALGQKVHSVSEKFGAGENRLELALPQSGLLLYRFHANGETHSGSIISER